MTEQVTNQIQPESLDALGAAKVARAYLRSMKSMLGDSDIKNIRLEEIQVSEDDQFWLVTLGFDRVLDEDEALVPNQTRREYKLFEIDSSTRKVKSMKIRVV
jgi:hypothetical protein